MADPLRKFAQRLRNVEKLAFRAATQPQLGNSSIEDGALQSVVDGSLKVIVGKQYDGTQGVTVVNGPIPPTPTAPICVPALEGIRVRWDGLFADGSVSPMDFTRVEVHASLNPDFTAEFAATLIGTFETPRGGEFFASLGAGDWTVKFVARAASGTRSLPSAGTLVTPQALDTLLPDTTDGLAPTTKPVVFARPLGHTGVVIQWSPITNPDPVRYKVLLDTVNPPIQELTDTSGTLAATSVLKDGTTLSISTPVFAQVVPYDSDGTGPASDVVTVTPVAIPASAVAEDVMVVNELFTRTGYFGTVSADKIETGDLLAAVAIVGGLSVGPGISIDQDNGIVVVHQDEAPGQPRVASIIQRSGISLQADVTATALTVLDRFALRGKDNEIATGAEIAVQAGTTAPKMGPQMTSEYPKHNIHEGFNPRGLVKFPADGADKYLFVESISNTCGITTVYRDSNDDFNFNFTSFDMSDNDTGNHAEVFSGRGGLAVIGSEVYTLVEVSEYAAGGSGRLKQYIYQWHFNGSGSTGRARFTYVRRWAFEPVVGGVAYEGGASPYRPALGYDGTNLTVVQANKNGDWVINKYTPSGGYVGRFPLYNNVSANTYVNAGYDLSGIVWGDFDGITNRFYVSANGRGQVYAYTATPVTGIGGSGYVRTSADDFILGTSDVWGLCHDGTRFIARAPANVFFNSRIVDTTGLAAEQTWRKHDATDTATATVGDFATYETKASPLTSVPINKRAYLRLQSPSAIPTSGGADALSFYTRLGSGGTFYLVPPAGIGVTSQLLDVLPTGGVTPPPATTFGASTPGRIKSAVDDGIGPRWYLDGNGDYKIGDQDSAGWVAYVPSLTSTAAADGNATRAARYKYIGENTIVYTGKYIFGTSTAIGSATALMISVPVAPLFQDSVDYVGDAILLDSSASVAGYRSGSAFLFSSSGLSIILHEGTTGKFVGTTNPWTWASGDIIRWTVIYQTA